MLARSIRSSQPAWCPDDLHHRPRARRSTAPIAGRERRAGPPGSGPGGAVLAHDDRPAGGLRRRVGRRAAARRGQGGRQPRLLRHAGPSAPSGRNTRTSSSAACCSTAAARPVGCPNTSSPSPGGASCSAPRAENAIARRATTGYCSKATGADPFSWIPGHQCSKEVFRRQGHIPRTRRGTGGRWSARRLGASGPHSDVDDDQGDITSVL